LDSLLFSGLPARKPLACNHLLADYTCIMSAYTSTTTTMKALQNGFIILTPLLNKARIFLSAEGRGNSQVFITHPDQIRCRIDPATG
jgi:hypothetical protein